jgi:hypothetical protein
MKTLRINRIFLLVFLMSGWMAAQGQSTIDAEVPGDNFSLEGALELFKKSASPEEFERLLNSQDSKVNNLDLNNDGKIDYIKVIDRNEDNVHLFILQAALSDTESQDVAVIELEKLADGKAALQITGDADVYGIETIIEPTEEVRVNAGATTSNAVVNVWTWPSVQYVYGPYYSPWMSPWSWAYHPMWWRPWSPVAFYVYSPWWSYYRPYYSSCYSHRIGFYSSYYRPYRRSSVIVYNHYGNKLNGYRSRNEGSRSRYGNNGGNGGRGRNDGYNGRSRQDYNNGRSNNRDAGRRFEANANSRSTNRSRSYEGIRPQNHRQNDLNTERTRTTPQRSYDRSPSTNGNSSSRPQRTYNSQQRTPETRDMGQVQRTQRQSSPSVNPGSRQQRSSTPSVGGGRSQSRSSSMPSRGSGGSRGGSGSHGNNGGGQRGGRHR